MFHEGRSGSDKHSFAAIEHHNLVRDGEGEVDMRICQNESGRSAEREEDAPQLLLCGRIEGARWFIKQKYIRLGYHDGGESHSLRFSSG